VPLFWIIKDGGRTQAWVLGKGEISEQNTWEGVTFLSHLKDLPPMCKQNGD